MRTLLVVAVCMLILTANAATASSNYQELEQAGTLSYGRMVPDGPHARQFQNCATGKYIVVNRSHKVTNVNATKCPGVPPLVAFNGATKFAPVADAVWEIPTANGSNRSDNSGGAFGTLEGRTAAVGSLDVQNGKPLQYLLLGKPAVGRMFNVSTNAGSFVVFIACKGKSQDLTQLVNYASGWRKEPEVPVKVLNLTLCPTGKDYDRLVQRLHKINKSVNTPIPT